MITQSLYSPFHPSGGSLYSPIAAALDLVRRKWVNDFLIHTAVPDIRLFLYLAHLTKSSCSLWATVHYERLLNSTMPRCVGR